MLRRFLIIAGAVCLMGAITSSSVHAATALGTRLLSSAGRMLDKIDGAVEPGFWWPDRCRISEAAAQSLIDNGEDLLTQLSTAYSAANQRGDAAEAMRLADAGEELNDALNYLDRACWDEDGYFYRTAALPVQFLSPFQRVMIVAAVEFAMGSSGFDWRATSSFPADASGNDGVKPNSTGLDVRAAWFLYNYMAVTTGFSASWYYAAAATRLFDMDPFSPGLDTQIRAELARAYVLYGGLMWLFPLAQSGEFGKQFANVAVTTYLGLALARYTGSVTTNEAGTIRQTNFDQSVTGLRVGVDVDYPLWFAFQAWRLSHLRPVVRLGASADFYRDFSVVHQAAFNTYAVNISPEVFWRVYLGLGLQFSPSLGVEAR